MADGRKQKLTGTYITNAKSYGNLRTLASGGIPAVKSASKGLTQVAAVSPADEQHCPDRRQECIKSALKAG